MVSTLKKDPTRLLTLRKSYVRAFAVRFDELARRINEYIVDQDALALKPPSTIRSVAATNQEFADDEQKIDAFKVFLTGELAALFLQSRARRSIDRRWYEDFIQQAYSKGAGHAFDSVEGGRLLSSGGTFDDVDFARDSFIRFGLRRTEHRGSLGRLLSRNFNEIEGMTSETAKILTRELADGVASAENPTRTAKRLRKALDLPKQRSFLIAHSEITRSHSEGILDGLEDLGVDDVSASVEWDTAGDGRVCPKCSPLNGVVLKITEARTLLPRHPACRCSWTPVVQRDKGQTRSKTGIDRAFRKSIDAERSKKPSSWAGKDKKIAKTRPKPIL